MEYARKLLAEAEQAVAQVRAFDQRQRTILVKSCAPAPLWELLKALNAAQPEKMVASAICQNDEVLRAWQDGSCDIAVLPFPIDGGSPFMQENLFVCVPKDHELATHKFLTFVDINGFNFLLRTELGFWDALCREKCQHPSFWCRQIMLCLTNWFGLPRCRALARIMEIFRTAIRSGSISRWRMKKPM